MLCLACSGRVLRAERADVLLPSKQRAEPPVDSSNRRAEAVEDAEAAIKLVPSYAKAFVIRGEARIELEEFEEAVRGHGPPQSVSQM